MNLDQAVRIVAQHLVANLIEDHAQHEWGSYPEIGENDFDAVLVAAEDLIAPPETDEFKAAYEFLTARASAHNDADDARPDHRQFGREEA